MINFFCANNPCRKNNQHKFYQQQNQLKKAFNDIKKAKFTSSSSENTTIPTLRGKEPEQLVDNEANEQNQTLFVNPQDILNLKFETIESRLNENITRSIAQIKDDIRKELSDHKISNIKWLITTVIAIVAILITFYFTSLGNLDKKFNEKIQILESSISNIIERLE